MEVKKNVVAAISAALGLYLQAEQEALMALQATRAAVPPQPYSPYKMAGRAAAMDIRWTWQMRLAR